jgi:hypothetical protein
MAHQADGEVAVEVHPVHGQERQQMADMEGGRCRVDADIDANALFGEEPVECVAAAAGHQQQSIVCLQGRSTAWLMAYGLPRDIFYEASLLKHAQHALLRA